MHLAGARAQSPPPAPTGARERTDRGGSPATPWLPWLGLAAFVLAFVTPMIFAMWHVVFKEAAPFTAGSAAAYVCTLILLGLILSRPSLIMDDAPDADGQPSTMRVLCLAIVFAFAAIVLRTAWNKGQIPSLENEGNWVWLVTAALGGKAVQKFAEMKDQAKAAPAAASQGTN